VEGTRITHITIPGGIFLNQHNTHLLDMYFCCMYIYQVRFHNTNSWYRGINAVTSNAFTGTHVLGSEANMSLSRNVRVCGVSYDGPITF
jgi:hypothetical protein